MDGNSESITTMILRLIELVFILRIRFAAAFSALAELIQLLAERFLDQFALHLLHGTRVGVGKHAGIEANKEDYPSMSSMYRITGLFTLDCSDWHLANALRTRDSHSF